LTFLAGLYIIDGMGQSLILPFGKHKGCAVEEIAGKDPGYLDWLSAQGWFAEKFGGLHQTIVTHNYGTEPAETPEHNAMQGEFIRPEVQEALLRSFP